MNQANTVFLMISTILVFFMTPGLAFFYGGLVSKKNVVNTMASVFVITGIAIILFAAFGYNIAFGKNVFGVFGFDRSFFLSKVDLTAMYSKDLGITNASYLLFQMMFSIITPALFVGAVVGRMKFRYLLSFLVIWSVLVYYPMVHMVWSPDGILAKMGMIDFAGGTVVHINAGITALLLSIAVGPRLKENVTSEHYSLSWVLLGTSILWIGWYGFNVGSAFAINKVALQAFLTTTIATGASMLTWLVLELKFRGKPSLIGICTGTLCGLVGITPAAGYVSGAGAFFIGVICTCASYLFINFAKNKIKLDDPLDAFGCHGVSGIMGSILTGLFASKSVNADIPENGLFYNGGWHLFLVQSGGTLITIIFVTILTLLIVKILNFFMAIRVSPEEEMQGLDLAEHDEKVSY
ncbi:ammonium transporter [Lactobacillus hamsteri]|uniref:Ammonium transporter n=1 Tax=Lactobacillus hamsteri DSM 5661 = JCM 6256 TaxID=1423754 RepID=A0A0R1Y4C2_9LACO|nr:ammonium transporter [Lactobacillus hamsteri]KRM37034.1 ammonium transporter [Lactobacillus hamsteri DSM 5661 = JCM 6256]